MRSAETYRADRRNTCLRPTMGAKTVWNSQFYYVKHKTMPLYIPAKANLRHKLRRAFSKAQKSSMRGIRRV